MSFESDIARYCVKLETLADGLLPAVAAAAHESIVVGSPITGAPGQPVDDGNLRSSWTLSFPSRDVAEISTKVAYARAIEHGIQSPYLGPDGKVIAPRRMTLRSTVGGFHSVALTIAGLPRLAADVVRRLAP